MIALFLALSAAQAAPLKANLLYFVLVDRFQNGNPNNDESIDTADIQAFHGGDLEGVHASIEHITSLGADALWLSPIFEMRTEKFGGHGAFHGYWVQHLDGIEPRFGGERALTSLQQYLQSEEIPLILDMVYNHVSFDSPMRSAHPDWFHNGPSIEDWNDPIQLTTHQVHGLPDLNQARPPVYNYLLHRSLHWAKQSQGYRIDAIRHLESSFIEQIGQDLRAAHPSSFWLLGEDFQGNPAALRKRAEDTGLDALFDFPLYYALTKTFCDQQSPMTLASTLWLDQYYPDTLQLVRFLDNHDLPRIITRCNNSTQKATQALFFVLSARGLPMLTYGTEVWLEGGEEPENRKDMPWEKMGGTTDISASIRSMVELRKTFPVLAKGKGWIEFVDNVQLEYHQQDETHRSIYLYNGGSKDLAIPKRSSPPLAAFIANQSIKKIAPGKLPESLGTNESVLLIYPASEKSERNIEVTISAPGPKTSELMLVGSDPKFGDWQPSSGLMLEQYSDGQHSVSFSLSENAVICYKLVKKIDQEFQWAQGENSCLFPKVSAQQQLPKFD